MGPASVVELANVFERTTGVHTLLCVQSTQCHMNHAPYTHSLAGNNMGDAGAIALADALTRNQCLRTLK
jgi:hypothetical protein